MKTRYFTPTELSNYILRSEHARDLVNEQCFARCSIADFIELCESQKKGHLRITSTRLLEQFGLFSEDTIMKLLVFVAELDSTALSNSLFSERNPTKLWSHAAEGEIPPLHSIRRLTLKDTEWEFWGENVYEEMEDFFS